MGDRCRCSSSWSWLFHRSSRCRSWSETSLSLECVGEQLLLQGGLGGRWGHRTSRGGLLLLWRRRRGRHVISRRSAHMLRLRLRLGGDSGGRSGSGCRSSGSGGHDGLVLDRCGSRVRSIQRSECASFCATDHIRSGRESALHVDGGGDGCRGRSGRRSLRHGTRFILRRGNGLRSRSSARGSNHSGLCSSAGGRSWSRCSSGGRSGGGSSSRGRSHLGRAGWRRACSIIIAFDFIVSHSHIRGQLRECTPELHGAHAFHCSVRVPGSLTAAAADRMILPVA